ncbi:TPA: hypothetical protein ACNECV_003308 [Escherichia coli]|uniref:hypothetical protein n=1 Tax=Escherichia coli TaxID=562 RepID=UPI0034A21C0C
MTTITKERLLTIKQWRETYGPGSNVVLPAEEAEELARIALASLEAKPIGAFHIAEQQVDGTSDYLKDGEWPIDNGIIEVYAAPPVPVVPEEKPMPNPLSMYAVDAVAAIAEVRGWNACRAAMLQSGNFRESDVITPDHHKQAEKSGLERCHLETALNIKPGHTLGIIDALLVHKMARALLPLVAEKHEADHANES